MPCCATPMPCYATLAGPSWQKLCSECDDSTMCHQGTASVKLHPEMSIDMLRLTTPIFICSLSCHAMPWFLLVAKHVEFHVVSLLHVAPRGRGTILLQGTQQWEAVGSNMICSATTLLPRQLPGVVYYAIGQCCSSSSPTHVCSGAGITSGQYIYNLMKAQHRGYSM